MRSRSLAGCLALILSVAPAVAIADPPAPAPAKPATPPPLPKPGATAKPPPLPPANATAKAAPKGKTTAAAKKKKKAKDGPVTGPIATYPGYRMLDGGGSRVLVTLSQKVAITEHKAEGKLTYTIAGVHVPTRTNRLPLLTGFFSTPVTKAELVERDNDVDLVIDVKNAAGVTYRVVETDKGAELQVDFPKVAVADEDGVTPTPDASTTTPATSARPTSAKSIESKSDSAY